LVGLLLATATVGVSSTSVVAALPVVLADLHGTQAQYGWMIGVTLLAAAASGPVWGKVAEFWPLRRLILIALGVFVTGSALAGTAPSAEALIGLRVIQGVGVGGVFGLGPVAFGLALPGAERSRWLNYFTGAQTTATLAGPLIGGVVLATGVSWRWTFYVGVPVAVTSALLLRRLEVRPRPRSGRRTDLAGFLLVPATLALLLVAISLVSTPVGRGLGFAVGGLAVVLAVVTVVVEVRAQDPVLAGRLFRRPETAAALVASAVVGLVMGVGFYLTQYLQIARGLSTLESSLWSLPLVGATLVSGLVVGGRISRTRRYRRWLVTGAAAIVVGMGALALVVGHGPLPLVALLVAVIGFGFGCLQQNLVVAAQNSAPAADLVAATSTATFLRTTGGAVASPLMAIVMTAALGPRLAAAAASPGGAGFDPDHLPTISALAGELRAAVEAAYAESFAVLLFTCLPMAAVLLGCVLLTRDRAFTSTEDGAA
jgi:MFS family permease